MRAIGVSPLFVLLIIQVEALLIFSNWNDLAILVLAMGILFAKTSLAENYGLFISHFFITNQTLGILGVIISAIVLDSFPHSAPTACL